MEFGVGFFAANSLIPVASKRWGSSFILLFGEYSKNGIPELICFQSLSVVRQAESIEKKAAC
jgi:hypothetical protein